MNKKKVFIRLKNGADITTYYKGTDNNIYTIHLSYKNNSYRLHSYYFDGNDVLDEQNYKNESEIEICDFDDFIKVILDKFPGIEILTS